MADLREYVLHSERHGGWAIFVLSLERGYFSTVSDFGNYAFCWGGTAPGMEFRRFLIQIHEDYLGSKLMHGWPNREEYDQDRTRRAIFEWLREMARNAFGNDKRWAVYKRERDLYRRARHHMGGDFWSEGDFAEWYRETSISDAYELRGYVLNRQFAGFYKHVWPRFVELLRAELAAEAEAKEVTSC